MGVGVQLHAPAALPPGMTPYPLYRSLGRPQGRSGRVRKISPPPGFDPRTVQPVASSYTDYAIPAHTVFCNNEQIFAWNLCPFCSFWLTRILCNHILATATVRQRTGPICRVLVTSLQDSDTVTNARQYFTPQRNQVLLDRCSDSETLLWC